MKKYFWILSLAVSFSVLVSCTKKADEISVTENQKEEMRKTAGDFLKHLKGILVNEIQSNGIVSAVAVCSETAHILSNNFGLERGVFIKRVSFKNRNQFNYPDEYESEILNKFASMKQRGELNENSEHSEIITVEEIKYIKYMKPIFIQAECLNCHGKENEIADPVKKIINKEYPQDKAIGYSPGDLRGAVSIKKLLD